MATQEFGIERVFDLGSYKSLRAKESVVINTDNYSKEEVLALRQLMLLRAYELYGMNKVLMEKIAAAQKENEKPLTGEQILDIITGMIDKIENELKKGVIKDA